ncbi:hydroxylysine kinase-like [Chiloscyllium plagiosum]|uniref:hydroxylysine kinase-like n=1 Tax=Chiloscyllium plagiosum TaxID=36176 RepID=UPI001CB86827|nr:hydroxylysine kinase-like [Chiloscyllium plagiosum]XP_043536096.1 hydroxylysine kinase-like [Chiloscyllium plagiosum]XP_043536097.1 hydroxylysine kinase-like [Chiloscyllium plagiosum]XP_043536098.1 hydroxylysine kinase-like [Chiloscyllium plagiosum]XP_043536099.1 hydroxylysine kinase-like [Chiloscyllium plagiosum]XP_043536100.1 hydroxylysine kinase-like [Chiloscyllium plagiosum]
MSSSEKPALIKPSLTEAQAVELVERLYGLKVSSVQPMPSYDDQNFHILVSENQVTKDHSQSYVLKVMNTGESEDADLIEAQTRAMIFLSEKGFPTPTPIPTIDGKIMSLETIEQGNERRQHMIRLLTYLPGVPFANLTLDHRMFYKMGRTFAQMDKALHEEFFHPTTQSLHREGFKWDLSYFHLLEEYLPEIEQGETRSIVKQVLQQFKEKLLPNLSKFRRSIIHGDCNEYNILLAPVDYLADGMTDRSSTTHPQPEFRISAILDFGDLSYGCFVYELAISIMYLMTQSTEPLSVGGHVMAGFESIIPLTEDERDALFLLVLCRFSQSLLIASHSVLLHPENEEYIMVTVRKGWRCLHQLWQLGKEAVERIWFDTARSY